MILTTTNTIEGFKIAEYKGIVSGTAVNIQKMEWTFSMQKYYAGMSEGISEIQDQAFQQLESNAANLNANAIVGISVDIELTTTNYVAISVTGTAVSIIKR